MSSMKNDLFFFKKRIILIILKNPFCLLAQRSAVSTLSFRDTCFGPLSNSPFSQSSWETSGAVPSFLRSSQGIEDPACAHGRDAPWPACYGAPGGTAKEASLCKSRSGCVSSTVSSVFQMPPTASPFMLLAFTLSSHVVIFTSLFQGL